jgi:hypothetical protein
MGEYVVLLIIPELILTAGSPETARRLVFNPGVGLGGSVDAFLGNGSPTPQIPCFLYAAAGRAFTRTA